MENKFANIFSSLKSILKEHEPCLHVTADTPDNYSLNAEYSEKWKKDIFFGAVQIKKNYVSYHLMPVYMYPELAKEISPELMKRMQGKSCFNFKTSDNKLFAELKRLTELCADKFRIEGHIKTI